MSEQDSTTERDYTRGLWMAEAFHRLGMKIYEGTVPGHAKGRRRAANKVARHSRRINRGR